MAWKRLRPPSHVMLGQWQRWHAFAGFRRVRNPLVVAGQPPRKSACGSSADGPERELHGGQARSRVEWARTY